MHPSPLLLLGVALGTLTAACAAPRTGSAPRSLEEVSTTGEASQPPAGGAAQPQSQPESQPQSPAGPELAASSAGAAAAAISGAGVPSLPPSQLLEGLPVALVEGEPIDVTELLSAWWQNDSYGASEYLERLVAARLATLEARRLGLVLTQEQVQRRFDEALQEIGRLVASGGTGLSIEDFLRLRLGLDPASYYERLRVESRRQLMVARVVRAWVLANERVEARVIVTFSPAKMEEVLAGLVAGESFVDLARRYSVDPSNAEGGRTAPIVRSEHSPLSQLAFATPVGEVGGPVVEGQSHLLLLVERRPEPLVGPWSEIGPAVEASLAERPMEDTEFLQWKLLTEREHPVDVSPFYRLVGEPLN